MRFLNQDQIVQGKPEICSAIVRQHLSRLFAQRETSHLRTEDNIGRVITLHYALKRKTYQLVGHEAVVE